MARTRSISSITAEISHIEKELQKLQLKQEALEAKLLNLQKAKPEIGAKQITDAFRNSGKSMQELIIFLEG